MGVLAEQLENILRLSAIFWDQLVSLLRQWKVKVKVCDKDIQFLNKVGSCAANCHEVTFATRSHHRTLFGELHQ